MFLQQVDHLTEVFQFVHLPPTHQRLLLDVSQIVQSLIMCFHYDTVIMTNNVVNVLCPFAFVIC